MCLRTGVNQTVSRESWRAIGRHWLKFNTVGAIGIGLQLLTLTALAGRLRLNYLIATALAVEATVLHNFIWHERWTWSDRKVSSSDGIARLIRFNLTTGALSLLGNLVFMRLLVSQAHFHYFLANVLTITACSFINFLVSDRLVFRLSAK